MSTSEHKCENMKQYTEISGAEFKKRVTGTPVYKTLNGKTGFVHMTHKYVIGLNADAIPFNPTGSCQEGGLCFDTIDKVHNHIMFNSHLAVITLHDDSRVYADNFWFKADKFTITEIIPLIDIATTHPHIASKMLNHHSLEMALKHNSNLICLVKPTFRTAKLVMDTIKTYGYSIRFIKQADQTYPLALAAVRSFGESIEFVNPKFHTKELVAEALKNSPMALIHVKPEHTYKMCLDAITREAEEENECEVEEFAMIQYIKPEFRTKELAEVAVRQCSWSLKWISPELYTEELILDAMRQNGESLVIVPPEFRTELVIRTALHSAGVVFEHIPDEMKTEEMALIAVKSMGCALKFVPLELQTYAVAHAAVQRDWNALRYIKPEFKTDEICGMALAINQGAMTYLA